MEIELGTAYLVKEDKPLNPEKSFTENGIKNHDNLRMILKMKGGFTNICKEQN